MTLSAAAYCHSGLHPEWISNPTTTLLTSDMSLQFASQLSQSDTLYREYDNHVEALIAGELLDRAFKACNYRLPIRRFHPLLPRVLPGDGLQFLRLFIDYPDHGFCIWR